MKLLLDTHVWLWYLLGDDRLSPQAKQRIEDPTSDLWISPITVWETLLLIEKGRLPVAGQAAAWVRRAMEVLPVREAALTFPIVLRSRTIVLPHEDPADRFLAATAVELEMTLVTADARLRECRELECFGWT